MLLGLAVAALAIARPAEAFSPYLVVPDPAVAEASPAFRYANMTDAEALTELDRRKVLYTKLDAAAGVRAPIRLTGRLHGVYFHSSLPPDERVVSMFEILDARLALALDDLAAVLERHEIDEIVHFSLYRPNVGATEHGPDDEPQAVLRPRASTGSSKPRALPPPKDAGRGVKQKEVAVQKAVTMVTAKKPTAKAPIARRDPALAGPRQTWAPPGTRHPAGLAIDVGLLHRKDGRWLSVAQAWKGRLGDKTCGEGAAMPEHPDARELRAIVCECSDLGVFTYTLTPNFNAAHADHFHMEIKPGVRWFLYH